VDVTDWIGLDLADVRASEQSKAPPPGIEATGDDVPMDLVMHVCDASAGLQTESL
jgi:hypothetical protein